MLRPPPPQPSATTAPPGGIRRVTRLIHLISASFGLALLGTVAVSLWNDHRVALERMEVNARNLARIVEEYARRSFETDDLVADAVESHIAGLGGVEAARQDRRALHRYLRALSERTHGDYLLVVDRAGMPVALSSQYPAPAVSLADRRWFQAHLAGAPQHVGEAIYSRLTDEILFTYSRALHAPDGSLDGAVQIAMRPGFLQDLAFSTEATRGTILTIWDLTGRVLARTGLRPEEVGQDLASRTPFQRFREAPAGTIHTRDTIGGDERIVAHRRLPDWPVIVTAGVPVASGLADFRRDMAWSLWLTGAVLAVLAALTVFAGAVGRREERAQEALAAAHAALQRANDELEARVAERTRDLAEANHRLRAGEARFRGIFNATFQSIGLLTPDGTLLEANETALNSVRRRPEEVVGLPLWETPWWQVDEAERERLRDAVRRAATGEFVRYEAALRDADGRTATMDFSLKPVLDEAGRVVLLVAEGRDISALKAAQAQLHEAQKLETLGHLTGGVAHDFNNLLMAVLGNLALLRKRLPDDPRLRRLLEGAVQGAERGAALTQRLLAFARRQELRPESIDLRRLMRGMTDLLRRSLGPAVRIAIEVPGDLPPVRADANQLELALLNLALNARDAMPVGGELLISAQPDSAPGLERPEGLPPDAPPGAFVRIAVTDNGTGMDAETLSRATEPFFTTKGPGKGSGLGLSMVHGLAAQSGGRLRIRSALGAGSTVELWLPVAQRQATPPAGEGDPPPASPAVTTRPLSVLLVDDDPLIQAGTAAMLEDLGHRVTIAASGSAALELLDSGRFELVVTDFAMPGMNGLELVRQLHARRPDLPLILATGYAELPEGEALSLLRLSKPYRQEDLAAAIARAVGQAPPVPAPCSGGHGPRSPRVEAPGA